MKKRRTHKEFVDLLYNINKNIEPIEEYYKSDEKILVKCKICNHEWRVIPNSLLRGTGCPACADKNRNNNNRKTHEQFIAEISIINPNLEFLERYTTNRTKILTRCKVCGYEWYPRPEKLLIGRGCPMCAREKIRLDRAWSQEKFESELFKVNPDIIVLGEYYNARTKILVKCKKCGHKWETTPDPLLNKGVGCPVCVSSKGEARVKAYLDNNNIKNIPSKTFDGCFYIHPLLFDFYLPDYNLCIEYDGKQHFEAVEWFGGEENFKKAKIRDEIKNDFCKNNNIDLLRIPYTEFDNVESILQDKLHIH